MLFTRLLIVILSCFAALHSMPRRALSSTPILARRACFGRHYFDWGWT